MAVDKTMWAERARTFAFFVLALSFVVLIALVLAARAAHADAAVFTVDRSDDPDLDTTQTADDCTAAEANDCSLRGAITAANSNNNSTDQDTINFAIPDGSSPPADGVQTILVDGKDGTSAIDLPVITEAVTINGYTQRPCLTDTGQVANPPPCSKANTNTVLAQGTNVNLLIVLNGAFLSASSGLIRINASDVVVKGLVLKCYNSGISIQPGGSHAVIEGNFIGTDPSGTTVSCMANNGVNVFGGGANTIGGQDPADRNLISGNLVNGISIADNGGNTIQGNLIGTKAKGANPNEPEPLGNGREGLEIFSPNNTVGNITGNDEAGANLIAFNGGDGVQVTGGRDNAFAVGNRILSNSIFSNGNLGIDLDGGPSSLSNPDADGVTPNDMKDPDTGPNRLQNFPRLTSATTTASGTTTIAGKLNSRPRKTYLIQFFSSETKNSAGFAEGKTIVGKVRKKTNQEGKLSFSHTTVLPAGENLITATATRLDTSTVPATPTDTSEFSKEVIARAP
jgi:parallel beta-helix repeat protein